MDKEITKYSYRLMANDDVVAFLYDASTTAVAKVIFTSTEGEPEPPLEVNGRLVLHFQRSRFGDFIDILRNESPVYLHWKHPHAYLSTEFEPVGEGEGIGD